MLCEIVCTSSNLVCTVCVLCIYQMLCKALAKQNFHAAIKEILRLKRWQHTYATRSANMADIQIQTLLEPLPVLTRRQIMIPRDR